MVKNSDSIGDIAAASRKRAREIDGADHDVRRGLSGRCTICGKPTRNDPRTPYAPVHRAESLRTDSPEYRKDYERGWRSSISGSGLDAADRNGNSRITAWMDGYLDQAAGRPKWHRLRCQDHEGC